MEDYSAGSSTYRPGSSPYTLTSAYVPPAWEYSKAVAARAFDKTLLGRIIEYDSTGLEEYNAKEAGTFRVYKDEEEYKAGPYYHPNIPWVEGMSETQARVRYEKYQQRREYDRIINAGDERGPWYLAPLGFGASIAGGLADTLLIFPAGPAVNAMKLAGTGFLRTLGRNAAIGAAKNIVGEGLITSAVAYDLNSKGEDITVSEVMTDVMFSALSGAAVRGSSALWQRSEARTVLRTNTNRIRDALPVTSPLRAELRSLSSRMKNGDADAYAAMSSTLQEFNDAGLFSVLRRNLSPHERLELARSIELSMADIANGNPVNMEPVRNSLSMFKAWDKASEEINARIPAGKVGDTLTVLHPEGTSSMSVRRGPGAAASDSTVPPGPQARTGRTVVQIKSADVTRADAMAVPRIMQEYEPITHSTSKHTTRVWVVPRDDGKVVIIRESPANNSGTTVKLYVAAKNTANKLSAIIKDPEGSAGGARSGRTNTQKIKPLSQGGAYTSAIIGGVVLDPMEHRNRIDWRPETPETFPSLPDRATLDAATRDMPSGSGAQGSEQAMLEALARDGSLAPHDLELLQRQADERAGLKA